MPDEKDKAKALKKTQKDLGGLEKRLAKANPGVLEILRVYGGYEDAMRQAEQYLGATEPELHFTTTDGAEPSEPSA